MARIKFVVETAPETGKGRDGQTQVLLDNEVARVIRDVSKREKLRISDFVEEAVLAWLYFAQPGKYEVAIDGERPAFFDLWGLKNAELEPSPVMELDDVTRKQPRPQGKRRT